MARVFFFSAVRDENGSEVPLTIPDDVEELRAVIEDRDIGLIVIDPLVAFFGKQTDSNNDKDVRGALRPLFMVLQETNTTAICLRHLTKDRSKSAMYRGGGSIGITGQARSAFLAAFDPNDENEDENARRRVLAHVKSNLGPKQKALAYTTVSETVMEGVIPISTSRIEWLGEVSLTAEEIAGGPEPHRGPDAYARKEAESVLAQLLAIGRVRGTDAEKEMKDHGFKQRTIRRAKEALGVRSKKEGADWYWYPAEDEPQRLPARREVDLWDTVERVQAEPSPDEPGIRCADYKAHQSAHRRVGGVWTCDACHPQAAA